jgi:hypothetical protein
LSAVQKNRPEGETAPGAEQPQTGGPARPGRWVLASSPEGADGLHLRVERRNDRLIITDLYLHADEITPEVLRAVSISRLEAALNALPRAAAQPPFDTESEVGSIGQDPSLADLRARASNVQEPTSEQRGELGLAGTIEQALPITPILGSARSPQRTRAPLARPDGRDPDDFYARVAEAYREYAPHTRAPAAEIAREAGVPATTAHRWIREARRRQFLPPGRKGKAG